MRNKFRAEVDAPEFGKGFTIRLDMDGHGKLETEFGEFIFAQKVHFGLANLSSQYVRSFLNVALRKDDELVDIFTMPDVALSVIAEKCLDAFTLFRYGKGAEAWAEENRIKVEKASAANPTTGTQA